MLGVLRLYHGGGLSIGYLVSFKCKYVAVDWPWNLIAGGQVSPLADQLPGSPRPGSKGAFA